jgi:hypothetical protein
MKKLWKKNGKTGCFQKKCVTFKNFFWRIMVSEKDMKQLEAKGISPEQVETQLTFFRTGFPFLPIAAAAVAGDGIVRLESDQIERLVGEYDVRRKGLAVVKFVPASGAASRMFKEMYEFVNEGRESESVRMALDQLEKFAFHDRLMEAQPEGADDRTTVQNIVEGALGYGKAPKALILFHRTADAPRTALEEHLVEGAMYAPSGDGVVRIHFTISPEHEAAFRRLVDAVRGRYEKKFGVRYRVDYSQQKPKTDTIAVDLNNEPFREADGTILFRPGGHGALLENLNDIDGDLIFIKTVDNVCPDRMKPDTVRYKKALAGLLLELQGRGFALLKRLEGDTGEKTVREAVDFARQKLSWKPAPDFAEKSPEARREVIQAVLNRPIRVCGMVKNEG